MYAKLHKKHDNEKKNAQKIIAHERYGSCAMYVIM